MKKLAILGGFVATMMGSTAMAGLDNEVEWTNLPVCDSSSMQGAIVRLGGSYFYVAPKSKAEKFAGMGCSGDVRALPEGTPWTAEAVVSYAESQGWMDDDNTIIVPTVIGDGYNNVDPDYDPTQPIVNGVNSPNASDDGVAGVVTNPAGSAPYSNGTAVKGWGG